jgi:pyruvate,water dikinase
MTTFVVKFEEIAETHRAQAGGKGYALGRLARARFPVPAGFVITTDAYHDYMRANGLDDLLSRIVNEDAAARSRRIEALFESLPLPSELQAEIESAYSALNVDRVAVRSSATAEDGRAASFAGQYETFLDVADRAALLIAVRRCWASLWGERALAYRERMSRTQATIAMAVVVQQMVDAAQSGVAFTLDPLSGRRDVMVIEAVAGMGAGLMNGHVAPRRYVVEERVDSNYTGDDLLGDQQLTALIALARKVEAWARQPQDIEWAFDRAGQLVLLQARPVTAVDQTNGVRWTRDNVGEVAPEPITPLSWSVLEPLGNDTFTRALRDLGLNDVSGCLFGRFYGHVYLNQTLFQEVLSHFYFSRAGWQGLARLMRLGSRVLRLRFGLPHRARELMERVRAKSAPQLDQAPEQLLAQIAAWYACEFDVLVAHHTVGIIGTILMQLLDKLAGDAAISELLALPAHVRSAAAGEALHQLALKVAADESLRVQASTCSAQAWIELLETTEAGRLLQVELNAYLSEYGHGAPQEFELASPRWRDDPALVVAALQARVRTLAAQATEVSVGLPGRRSFHPRALWIRETLRFIVLRENLKDAFVFAHGNLRRLYLAIGKAMVDAGVLHRADLIFFLTQAEVAEWVAAPHSFAELRACAIARQRELHKTRRLIPFEVEQLADGRLIQHDRLSSRGMSEDVLYGVPVSSGTFVGRARVAHSPDEAAALEPGEVLVTPAVTPGWAPLLRAAGALVTEIGGLLSHGAVITREYGLPAVLDVPGATELIQTGRRVRVDGTQGQVHLLEES